MKISNEMMARLAALSKLELTPAEREQLSGELETVVNYMDILSQLPAEAPEQNAPGELRNVLREDRVIPGADRAELLSNAPETDGVTLSVPKTVN